MNKNLSQLKVVGIGTLLTYLLFGSAFLVVFTPFPLYYVLMLYGRRSGHYLAAIVVLTGLMICLFSLPVLDGYIGLVYLGYFLLFGYLLGEGMARKWSITKLFGVTVGGSFLFLALVFVVLQLSGVSVISGVRGYMEATLNELIKAQESAGLGGDRIFAIRSRKDQIVDFSMMIMPSVIFLFGLVCAGANYLLGRRMIKVSGKFAHLGDVAKFSIPHQMMWITIALGFLYFMETYFANSLFLKFISLNGLLLVSGIYLFQGLLIISYYLKSSRSKFFKALIYVMIIIFSQVALPLLTIVGLTDLWVDYRRLTKKGLEKQKNRRSLPWK